MGTGQRTVGSKNSEGWGRGESKGTLKQKLVLVHQILAYPMIGILTALVNNRRSNSLIGNVMRQR